MVFSSFATTWGMGGSLILLSFSSCSSGKRWETAGRYIFSRVGAFPLHHLSYFHRLSLFLLPTFLLLLLLLDDAIDTEIRERLGGYFVFMFIVFLLTLSLACLLRCLLPCRLPIFSLLSRVSVTSFSFYLSVSLPYFLLLIFPLTYLGGCLSTSVYHSMRCFMKRNSGLF